MATTVYINGVKVNKEDLKNIVIESERVKRIIREHLHSTDEKEAKSENSVEHLFDYKTEVCYCMDLLNDLGQSRIAELAKKLTMIPEYRKDAPHRNNPQANNGFDSYLSTNNAHKLAQAEVLP